MCCRSLASPAIQAAIGLLCSMSASQAQLPEFDEASVVKVVAYQNMTFNYVRLNPYVKDEKLEAIPSVKHGSGTLISSDGLVITAKHIVDSARYISIWIPGTAVGYPSIVAYKDDNLDFAILCIIGEFDHWYSSKIRPPKNPIVGERIWAYGYPVIFGEHEPAISTGIIARWSRQFALWQMDAMAYPGSSGGPVINSKGNIVAIIVSQLSNSPGLNYCQQADTIFKVVDQLRNAGIIANARASMTQWTLDEREIQRSITKYLSAILTTPEHDIIENYAQAFVDENYNRCARSSSHDCGIIYEHAAMLEFNRIVHNLSGSGHEDEYTAQMEQCFKYIRMAVDVDFRCKDSPLYFFILFIYDLANQNPSNANSLLDLDKGYR